MEKKERKSLRNGGADNKKQTQYIEKETNKREETFKKARSGGER